MTRLFCCLIAGAFWWWSRPFVPASWSRDYCEDPRLEGRRTAHSGPYSIVVISLLFYLSPDVFTAFCLLHCAYTDALDGTVEDQWIAALFAFGLVTGPQPAAALAPLALWLAAAVPAAALRAELPIGLADAKLFSALGLALGAGTLLQISCAAFIAAGLAAAVLAALKKRKLALAPFILFAWSLIATSSGC